MEFDIIKEKDISSLIQIEDLSVWTPEEKSWWRRKITKPRIQLLNKISGCIQTGEFVAVLGPSGAGKTTFLVTLAGKCRLPMQGIVTVGGRDVVLEQGAIEIVPQFDIFMPRLSVMEHMVFMMELKTGSYKNNENRKFLNDLMEEMRLKKIAHTYTDCLSGGERRLLSLATSLLSNPQVLICDEPTTGLDSYSALLVIDTLKKLTVNGRVVICSVHQPSTDLFKEFSSLILMADGKLLFHGSHRECEELFESINLRCPKNYNSAEFYIRAVSHLDSSDNLEKILKIYSTKLTQSEISPIRFTKPQAKTYRRNWLKQVQLLLWRSSLSVKRNLKGEIAQLLINVVLASLIIATCYAGISGTTQRGVQDMAGFLWLMVSEVIFNMSYTTVFAFEAELPLYRREVGTYSCSAYFVSKFLGYIPRCIIWPLVLVFLMTMAVQLPNHALTATLFFITLSYTAIAASSFGLGIGALCTGTGALGDVMPSADLPLFTASGVFYSLNSLPGWMYLFKYISHFYYAMDAVSNVYWRQIGHIDCQSNNTSICVNDGASVLIEKGYSDNFVLNDSFGLLFITAFWSFLGYLGLKREERKGYVY